MLGIRGDNRFLTRGIPPGVSRYPEESRDAGKQGSREAGKQRGREAERKGGREKGGQEGGQVSRRERHTDTHRRTNACVPIPVGAAATVKSGAFTTATAINLAWN